jgi:hypothetical protein
MDERPMPDRRGWWDRNWKWFVPTGCLTVLLAGAMFVAGIFALVVGMMRQSDAYGEAMRRARASTQLQAAIGTPMEEGRFVTGSFEESGPSGTASLAIPVSGPRGGATIYVEGRKSAGQWQYDVLVAQLDASGERIELEPAESPPAVE